MEQIRNKHYYNAEDALLLADQMVELASEGKSITLAPADMDWCARAIFMSVLSSPEWRLVAKPFVGAQD